MVQHGFQLVGYADLKAGEYGDVAVQGSDAYLGTRCGPTGRGGQGVRVASIADASHPRLVSTLPAPPYSRAEDVAVGAVSTRFFKADLAAIGLQTCPASGHAAPRGIRLFDVRNPAQPQLVSEWLLPAGAAGCHEVDLVQRADGRALVACARNLADQNDPATRAQRTPAVQLVDV